VTGAYSIAGITPGATTPLYVALLAGKNSMVLGIVPAPAASGTFTITNVPPGHYRVQGIVDANNSHANDAGDLNLGNNMAPVVVVDGSEGAVPVKGGKLVFTRSGSLPQLSVQHTLDTTSSIPAEWYNLNFEFQNNSCFVTGVSIANGATGTLPLSPVSVGRGNWGSVGYWTSWSNARPNADPVAGDLYQATIEYSDSVACPNEIVPLRVQRINDDFARASFPRGTVVDNPVINASWRIPNPQPYYYYDFQAWAGNNGGGDGFPPSMLSTYLGPLNSSTQWDLQSRDMAGNSASARYSYSVVATGPQITGFSPVSGVNGTTTVTISGSGFMPGGTVITPIVKFNGAQATVSASSDTSITVTVPGNASQGPITVTAGGVSGVTGISTTEFTPTISFGATGASVFVADSSNLPVSGVVVHPIGIATSNATTDINGQYTITGITSGMPLDFKLSKTGYLDTYTNFGAYTANVTTGNYGIFTNADLTSWNVAGVNWTGTVSASNPPAAAMTNMIAGSRGIIRSRTVDANNTSVNFAGVVVTAYSWRYHGQQYKVVYGGTTSGPDPTLTSTGTNGRFYVLDVDDGDFVTVVADKAGYIFRPRSYNVRGGAVGQSSIQGALAPIVAITPPPNPQDMSPLAITLTTANPSSGIYWTVNGTDPRWFGSFCTSPCNIAINPPAPSTSAAVTVRAVAMAAGVYGDQASATYNLFMDTTPPVLTINPGVVNQAGLDYTYTNSLPLNVTFTSNEQTTIYYTTNGLQPTTADSVVTVAAANGTSTPISISQDLTVLKYFGKDTTGNSSQVQTVNYVLDTTPPTISQVFSQSIYNNRAFSVFVNASDVGGIAGYMITGTSTPPSLTDPLWNTINPVSVTVPADGDFSYFVWAKDSAGNLSAAFPFTFKVDTLAPIAPTITPFTNNRVNSTTPTVTGTAEANSSVQLYEGATPLASATANVSGTWSAGLPFLTEGSSHTIIATATDAAGNISPGSNLMTFTIDTTLPTTTASPAGGTQTGPISVYLTVSEPATIYYTTDGADPTTSSLSFTDSVGNVPKGPIAISGNTTLKYFAKDLAGNSEAPIKQQVYFYGTPTTLTLGLGGLSSIVYGDNLPVTATITPGAGPTGTVQFFVDGSPYGAAVPLSGTLATTTISGLQVAGSPHTISAVYGGDASYASSSDAKPVTVSKAGQAVTFGALSGKTFGDAPFTLSATASSTLPVSFSIFSGPATISGTTVTITGAGTVVVRASQAGNANYSAAADVDQSFVVAQATQSITFGALAGKTYGTAPFTVSATASSTLPVSFSILSGPATISGTTVTITGVGTVVVRASQAGNANYSAAANVDQSFVVAQATQSITFGTLPNRNVTDAPFTVSASASSSLPVSFSIVSGPATISGNTITLTGTTGTVVVRATQVGDTNYTAAAPVDQSFLARSAQTITFGALSGKTYGDAPFTVSATASSTLPVSFSIVSGPATINGTTVTITGAGTVVVRASQAGDALYNAAPDVDQSFVVAQATQSITFGALAGKTYGTAPFSVSATASSTLPVSFSIFSGPATISGTTVTITGTGTVVVRASQAGNANYSAAADVDQSFVVAQAMQSITFGALAGKTYGNAPFTVSATASSTLPVSFSIFSGPATISGTTVTITGAGTVVVRASQAGDANYSAAANVDQSFVVAQATQSITFGTLPNRNVTDAPFTVSASASSSLPVSFSIVSGPATISGNTITLTGTTGTVVVRATQVGDTNYTAAAPVDQSFLARSAQTITFGALSGKTYGDAPFTVSATASSTLPVSFSIFSGPATINGTTVTITGAGAVVVRASQAGDALYNAAPDVDQSFVVAQAAQSITFGALAGKTYGTAPFSVSATASSTLPVSVSILSGPATISGTTVTITGAGTVVVRTSQAGNANYSAAADVDQSFVVGKAALTITTNDKVRFAKVANPTFSATYSGFVNGDTAAVLGGALTFATAATITSDPGTYPITPAGQTSGNYTITFVPGTLTVRVIGDISGGSGSSDGVFDLADALKYLRISLGLDPAPASLDGIKMAPVIGGVPSMPTGGSRVTVGDVVAALEHLVGLW